ncbi:MAG: hypothetical protein SynsKO_21160 [Synoicihabitans sp.]
MLRLPSSLFRSSVAVLALLASLATHAQTPEMRQLKTAGPRANTINMVFLGDGYQASEKETYFEQVTVRMNTILQDAAMAPFADLTNVFAIFVASNESGTTIPFENITKDTYFKASYTNVQNSRLVYVADATGRERVFSLLESNVPEYDYVALLVNSTRYGGAGGFPMVATVDDDSLEVLLHESGHSFANLTDEYVDENVADSFPVLEHANSTTKTDRNEIVWRKFILDSTPLPTLDVPTDPLLVGLWEGSNYRSTGNYRPLYDSKMRSLGRPWGPISLKAFADAVHALDINGATATPTITQQPDSTSYTAGGPLSLSTHVTGIGPFSYQWVKDGKYLVGETQATLSRANTDISDYGTYAVEVSNAKGTVLSSSTTISASSNGGGSGGGGGGSNGDSGRLVNLSVRSRAGSGSETLTVGFVSANGASATTKSLLVRAIGPTLTDFNVDNALPDPSLTLAPLNGDPIAQNDNWSGTAEIVGTAQRLGAFPLTNTASLDAAVVSAIGDGPHTAQVTGADSAPGVALVEVYDADDAREPRLVNVSARSRVGTGDDVLIAGFVLQGPGSMRLLVRAIGPTLSNFDVVGVLPDPILTIRRQGSSTVLAENDNWDGTDALKSAFTQTGAFALPNDNSRDAVVILEIEPGAYTATVSDVGGVEGVALVEIYELP